MSIVDLTMLRKTLHYLHESIRTHHRTGLVAVHRFSSLHLLPVLVLVRAGRTIGVRSHHVSAKGVPCLAGLLAGRTLVGETSQVGLDVLLHCVAHLGGEVALGALPDGLADHRVVGGDQQLGDRLLQLVHVLLVLLGRGEDRPRDGQRRVWTLHFQSWQL